MLSIEIAPDSILNQFQPGQKVSLRKLLDKANEIHPYRARARTKEDIQKRDERRRQELKRAWEKYEEFVRECHVQP